MDALVFDGPAPDPSRTRIADLPPGTPGPRDVAIDVRAAGVNFKDVMARRGDPGYVAAWPFVPGMAVAGVVRALGDEVGHLAVGQRVTAATGAGGLAQVVVSPATSVVATPDGLDDVRAAAAPGALLTAWLIVHGVGRVRAGDVVLVHSAAGGVGSAVAAIARAAGASRLVGTVGRPERARDAEASGYDTVLVRDHHLADAAREALGDAGADLVLDPQGTSLLGTDLDVLAPSGTVVLFGNAAGGPLEPLPAAARLFAGNAAVAGFSLAALTASAPQRVSSALEAVLRALADRELAPSVATLRGLDRAAEAQQALAEGRRLPGIPVVSLTSTDHT